MIEQLKLYEKDQLKSWDKANSKFKRKFFKDLVKFADSNPNDIKNYCLSTIPQDLSSLCIIYEALSEYSNNWYDFLFEEIKRVTELAKNKIIKADLLNHLTDIKPENVYDKHEESYIDIINYLTSQLNLNNDNEFNYELLQVIDWFLIDLDEDDDIQQTNLWINRIKELAENSNNSNVREEAIDTLDNFENIDIKSYDSETNTSFIGKLLNLFKQKSTVVAVLF